MNNNPKISISIVSHNSGKYIKYLLNDLFTLCNIDFEIILTINIPESLEFLECFNKEKIKIITNKHIKGYGANHNQAFRNSSGAYFLVLNPDIRIKDFNFEKFIISYKNNQAGILSPLIYNSLEILEDTGRKFPTIYSLIKRRFYPSYKDYDLGYSKITKVDWIGGMFMLFSNENFKKLDGFDEGYFMYLEDTEICRHARDLKLDVIVDSQFQAEHLGQNFSRKRIKYLMIHIKSFIKYMLFQKRSA